MALFLYSGWLDKVSAEDNSSVCAMVTLKTQVKKKKKKHKQGRTFDSEEGEVEGENTTKEMHSGYVYEQRGI